MRKVLLALALLSWATGASAQIAFDTSFVNASVNASSFTFSYTVTGANPALFVAVFPDQGFTASVVSYNGVSLTQVDSASAIDGGTGTFSLWLLVGPATGTHTVSVTLTGAANVTALAASYTGVKQTGQPDAKTTGGVTTASSDPSTISLTTVADNSWIVAFGQDAADCPWTVTTNGTPRAHFGSGSNFDTVANLVDTNGAQTPAGSHSIVVEHNFNVPVLALMASLAPATGGGGTFIPQNLTILGAGPGQ